APRSHHGSRITIVLCGYFTRARSLRRCRMASHLPSGSIPRGLLAGLIATIVVSLLMLLKQALGFMPHVNLVMELAYALGTRSALGGWTAHFVIGVIAWGMLFVWFDRYSRFPHWINGVF